MRLEQHNVIAMISFHLEEVLHCYSYDILLFQLIKPPLGCKIFLRRLIG